MTHTIDGATVYTYEEVQTKELQATTREYYRTIRMMADITLGVLRDKVADESLTEEQALDIYNTLSSKVSSDNWPTIETIVRTWIVRVSYNYDEILAVDDVKADSEEDAIAEVRDNLSIHNVRLSFDIEYDGEGRTSDSADVDYDDDDVHSNLDFSAEEQD